MNFKKGFTLIELLVVISIIGIVATVVVTSLQGARTQAKSAQFVLQLGQVEKAFLLAYLDEDRTDWWTENEIGMNNPSISEVMAIETGPLSTFSDYMKNEPILAISSAEVEYDNDGDLDGDCTNRRNIGRGTVLIIRNVNYDVVHAVDQKWDGGIDRLCGRVKHNRRGSNSACRPSDTNCVVRFSIDADQSW